VNASQNEYFDESQPMHWEPDRTNQPTNQPTNQLEYGSDVKAPAIYIPDHGNSWTYRLVSGHADSFV